MIKELIKEKKHRKKQMDKSGSLEMQYVPNMTGFDSEGHYNRVMNIVNTRASYYRANPQRFIKEYLGITYLKWFQEIIIYAMMHFDFFMFIASRGLGKTYLIAIFACTRCILYPGTKIVIASGLKSQALAVIHKIVTELIPDSPALDSEIEKYSTNPQLAGVTFKNGSYIETVASNDGARSKRANILIFDEFRMIDKNTLDESLKPLNANPRLPRFLSNPKYADYPREENKQY